MRIVDIIFLISNIKPLTKTSLNKSYRKINRFQTRNIQYSLMSDGRYFFNFERTRRRTCLYGVLGVYKMTGYKKVRLSYFKLYT